jgi:hypothetical protein
MKTFAGIRLALPAALALSALTVAAGAQGGAPKPAEKPAPKLVIAATEHNFGVVKEGAKLAHTFVIKNEGRAALEILRVSPS